MFFKIAYVIVLKNIFRYICPILRKEGNMAKIIGEGITFDDVLLVPHYSDLVPNEVD